MVCRRRDMAVVGEKWQGNPPDTVSLLFFTRGRQRYIQ